ncbi:restriction endonuclease subunit S [Rossellomorea marisflavi]|uniref:restriction endonuclease subunit S n=1 Tax=Rossellomorea marisflavi TaxID=189381 RepID=UPI003F9F8E7B
MKKWREVTLGEISTSSQYGYTQSAIQEDTGWKFLRMTDIKKSHIEWDTVPYCQIEERNVNKYKLEVDDIVIARTGDGSTGANAIIIDEVDAVFASYLLRFKVNKEIANPYYVYCVLSSLYFSNFIQNVAVGSGQKNINAKQVSNFSFKLPTIEYQNKITSIVRAIDDKIQLNNQINKNLEEMAMTIYKHWFVDFGPFQEGGFVDSELGKIPKGWKVKSIKDITSKFCTGLNPRKNFKLGEGSNYYVTIKNMKNNHVVLDEKCDKITDDAIKIINKRSDLQTGDLLFSGIGTIGRVYYIDEKPKNWNISESIFSLRTNETVSDYFLYLTLLSPKLQSYAHHSASGSVQKGVRKKDLESYKLIVPENNIMSDFTNKVSNILLNIKSNEKENRNLANIRDYLLPKLLSGEIELSEAKETVENMM